MTESVLPENVAGRRRAGHYRTGRLAATMLGLTLLAAAAGACSSGGGGSSQPADGGSATAAAPKGVQVPAKIGSLTKQAQDPGVKAFDTLPKSVARNLVSVVYVDSADSTQYVLIGGGPGLPVPADGSPDVIQRLFSEWAVSAHSASSAKVPAGSVGGTAECAPSAAAKTYLICGWVSGKIALTMTFNHFPKADAKALVPKILEAMVTS